MKTKIFSILSALLITNLLPAQEKLKTYLPIFSEDTTRYHIICRLIDCCPDVGNIDYVKDKNEDNVYNHDINSSRSLYGGYSVEVDERNSKMWMLEPIYYYDTVEIKHTIIGYKKYLIMDLDLEVGDRFINAWSQGYPWETSYTVSRIYTKDNRKHIEFEGLYDVRLSIESARVEQLPYLFIEGVGPNTTLSKGGPTSFVTLWLRSQYKDNELAYGAPEWHPFWGFYCWPRGSGCCYPCDPDGPIPDSLESIDSTTQSIRSEVENNVLRLFVPDDLLAKGELLINLSDAGGKIIRTAKIRETVFSLDMSPYPSGIYLIQAISANYRDVIKFLKP